MFKTVTSLFVVALVIAVLGVTNAQATTFCVPNFSAACPNNGTNVAQADIQTATSTNATDGIADTVILDAQTISHNGSIVPTGTDSLTVEGQGPTTRVTSSMVGGNYFIVDLYTGGAARPITLRNFTIVIPAAMTDNGGAAAQVADDTLENVDIESQNPGASGMVSWVGGGTYRGGRMYSTGVGSISNGVRTDGNATGTVNIEDATIDHPTASAAAVTGPGTVNLRRSHLVGAAQTSVSASNGTTNIQNSVVEAGNNAQAVYALANSANNVTVNADHVTVLSGGGNAAAFASQVAPAQTGNATVHVSNSIARNYFAVYLRAAPVGAGTGNADLSISYSNFHLTGSEASVGDGTLTTAPGNIDSDPQFVSASDFQLKPGSPSIDAGDPAAGGLIEDYLKAPRPTDGDANGTSVRDQGAYEYQPPAPPSPPVDPSTPVDPVQPTDPSPTTDPGSQDTTAPDTVKGRGPKAKVRTKTATFEFSSEAGATFNCTLDGTALASCVSPMTVAHLKRGKHVFTAAAADAAGNVDQTPASWTFKVAKKHKHRH